MTIHSDSLLSLNKNSVSISGDDFLSVVCVAVWHTHALFLTLLTGILLPLSQPRSMTSAPGYTFNILFLGNSLSLYSHFLNLTLHPHYISPTVLYFLPDNAYCCPFSQPEIQYTCYLNTTDSISFWLKNIQWTVFSL